MQTGGVAKAVEHLLCECLLCKLKALSSNPSHTKKKKNLNPTLKEWLEVR
jgi:hypothetical protein